jgi:hypothetical protein
VKDTGKLSAVLGYVQTARMPTTAMIIIVIRAAIFRLLDLFLTVFSKNLAS